MSQCLDTPEICAPAASGAVDFSAEPKKWATVPYHSMEPTGLVAPLAQAGKARPRHCEMLMTPSRLDAVEKRIWWECLKRNHPTQARALQDKTVQELLNFFDGSLVIS